MILNRLLINKHCGYIKCQLAPLAYKLRDWLSKNSSRGRSEIISNLLVNINLKAAYDIIANGKF